MTWPSHVLERAGAREAWILKHELLYGVRGRMENYLIAQNLKFLIYKVEKNESFLLRLLWEWIKV